VDRFRPLTLIVATAWQPAPGRPYSLQAAGFGSGGKVRLPPCPERSPKRNQNNRGQPDAILSGHGGGGQGQRSGDGE
jgi:hypothetical protein